MSMYFFESCPKYLCNSYTHYCIYEGKNRFYHGSKITMLKTANAHLEWKSLLCLHFRSRNEFCWRSSFVLFPPSLWVDFQLLRLLYFLHRSNKSTNWIEITRRPKTVFTHTKWHKELYLTQRFSLLTIFIFGWTHFSIFLQNSIGTNLILIHNLLVLWQIEMFRIIFICINLAYR